MYLTDIRGFTAISDILIYRFDKNELQIVMQNFGLHGTSPDVLLLCADSLIAGSRSPLFNLPPVGVMCKITLHGMGVLGEKGISRIFADFCKARNVEPRYISLSDMGISFFIAECERERVLRALCEYFPIWE